LCLSLGALPLLSRMTLCNSSLAIPSLALFLLLLLLLSVLRADAQPHHDAVLANQVTGVLLHKGAYANARRTHRIAQLQCVGGAASGRWEPDTVACTKAFTDGRDTYWRCECPDMPDIYKFGTADVNCEGYNYPDDPYILRGSCALRYTLEFTEKGIAEQQQQWQWRQRPHAPPAADGALAATGIDWESLLWTAIIVGPVMLFMCFSWCTSWLSSAIFSPLSWFSRFFASVQSYPAPPPSYDTTAYGPAYTPIYPTTYNAAAPTPPRPGFWSGLLGGGLLGYLWNRWSTPRPPPPIIVTPPTTTTTYHNSHTHSPSPKRERTAVSFATESRR